MNPSDVITKLLKIKPELGVPILAGMAVLAAAAIVNAWFDNNIETAIYVAGWILTFSILVFLVSTLFTNDLLRAVVGWIIVIFFVLIFGAFSYASIVVDPRPLKRSACMIRFWENCEKLKDELDIGSERAPRISVSHRPPTPIPPAMSSVSLADYRVYLQFAGYHRDTIIKLADVLSSTGWRIQGADRGGERLKAAANLAQVRYHSEAQKDAADMLAKEIIDTGVNTETQAVKVPVVNENVLEVWIGLK